MPKLIKIRCSVEVKVEWQDSWADPFFQIEENGCPATGSVGAAFDKLRLEHEAAQTCWACGHGGRNKIVSIDGVPASELPSDYWEQVQAKLLQEHK